MIIESFVPIGRGFLNIDGKIKDEKLLQPHAENFK